MAYSPGTTSAGNSKLMRVHLEGMRGRHVGSPSLLGDSTLAPYNVSDNLREAPVAGAQSHRVERCRGRRRAGQEPAAFTLYFNQLHEGPPHDRESRRPQLSGPTLR